MGFVFDGEYIRKRVAGDPNTSFVPFRRDYRVRDDFHTFIDGMAFPDDLGAHHFGDETARRIWVDGWKEFNLDLMLIDTRTLEDEQAFDRHNRMIIARILSHLNG
jgi:hypothetical protein